MAESSSVLTVSETARLLGKSEGTVRQWERRGKLKAAIRTNGGDRLFTPEEVARVAEQSKK